MNIKSISLLPALLLCFSVFFLSACNKPLNNDVVTSSAQDELKHQFYLRGGFNNWGTSNELTQVAKNTYQTKVNVGLGIHEYKISTQDWQTQLMNNDRSQAVVDIQGVNQKSFSLAINATEDADLLLVESAGEFQFTLDMSNAKQPHLAIARLDDLTLASDLTHNEQSKVQLSFKTVNENTAIATFSTTVDKMGNKQFTHSTSQPLRDPVPQINQFSQDKTFPTLDSGNTAFDALYALAIDEMKLNSVANINDAAYNFGDSIACPCFKTGEKWDYVWTRDLSYAAHLGLGFLDPQRVKSSLEFKLSGYRNGMNKPANAAGSDDGLQIIQDTGSGGSWPISTDRVTWAFGAQSILNTLSGNDRQEFAKTAYLALSNTIENDRLAAFDQRLGLYNGEQSFLDWREQTYADWIKDDLSYMATSKSISTNAGHYQAINLAATLATELGKAESAERYQAWASQLKQAINAYLWLPERGMYSSLTAGHFDNAAMHKFDWLGQSLAIITGIASKEQSQKILANYPHGPMGAPVIFPQQPGIRIYHNRSIWPFVTAYGLKAAISGDNVTVANAAFDTLIRGAALNLSNMENLEWLSAQSIWLERDDVSLSGPVINSKHQLWSVAAYLNMVLEGVFGVQATANGLLIEPFITTQMHQEYFSHQQHIVLNNVAWLGKSLNVVINLPTLKAKNGVYQIANMQLNGKAVTDKLVTVNQLLDSENTITVELGAVRVGQQQITRVDAKPQPVDEKVFAPYDAQLTVSVRNKQATVTVLDKQENVQYQLYRNGVLVADNLTTKVWNDAEPINHQACYSVASQFIASTNTSHHSKTICVQPAQVISIADSRVQSTIAVETIDGIDLIKDFGAVQDTLTVSDIEITTLGSYALQLNYKNIYNKTNTGITAGVKWLQIIDSSNTVVSQSVIQMPHIKAGIKSALSTPVIASLTPSKYTIKISDFYNMSYLTNNQTYSQSGGEKGAENKFDIFSIHISAVSQ